MLRNHSRTTILLHLWDHIYLQQWLLWTGFYTCFQSCKTCTHHFANFTAILISVSTTNNTTEEKSNYTSGSSMRSNSTNHYMIDTFSTNSRAQCQLRCAVECLTRDQCTGYNCENEICTLFSSSCSRADNSAMVFIISGKLSRSRITAGRT